MQFQTLHQHFCKSQAQFKSIATLWLLPKVRKSFENMLMTPAGFTSPSNAALGGAVTIQTADPVLVTLPRALLETALTAAVRAG